MNCFSFSLSGTEGGTLPGVSAHKETLFLDFQSEDLGRLRKAGCYMLQSSVKVGQKGSVINKAVSVFQGSWCEPIIAQKVPTKVIANIDALFAV